MKHSIAERSALAVGIYKTVAGIRDVLDGSAKTYEELEHDLLFELEHLTDMADALYTRPEDRATDCGPFIKVTGGPGLMSFLRDEQSGEVQS